MPKKIKFTQEMIDDLGIMSMSKFSKKWNISRPSIAKFVRENNIQTLTGENGLIKHRFIDNIEYKRCGHCFQWLTLDNFFACATKPDGKMANCKICQDIHARKSKRNISKKWTNEMIADLYKMGDDELSEKWNVSRNFIIKERKARGIKPFNGTLRTIEHKFIDGIEYKWCSEGHWDVINNFKKTTKKECIDGYWRRCIEHAKEERQRQYHKTNKEYCKKWIKTERGRLSRKLTYQKTRAKEKDAYIYWSLEEEKIISNLFENKCGYCGKSQIDEYDHFQPLAHGGKTVPGNMVPVCVKCNRGPGGKFDTPPEQWVIANFGVEKYNQIVSLLQQHANMMMGEG